MNVINEISKEYLSKISDMYIVTALNGGYGPKIRNEVLFHIRSLAPKNERIIN